MPGNVRLPIDGVFVIRGDVPAGVANPLFENESLHVSQQEYMLTVPGVGSFYARDGREVNFRSERGADEEWVRLYLNGQVLVALLHQRKIINFHASSFIHDGRGIMVLGETGAGKSSMAVSFALAGAGFLTDDLTPVVFRDEQPYILPLYREVKIREHTAEQLKIGHEQLRDAETGTGKRYLSLKRAGVKDHRLHVILKIETGDVSKPEFKKLSPAEKFSLLRSEICSWEILAGMPETEAAYLQQLLHIVEQVRFMRVVRPTEVEIAVLHAAVRDYLAEGKG